MPLIAVKSVSFIVVIYTQLEIKTVGIDSGRPLFRTVVLALIASVFLFNGGCSPEPTDPPKGFSDYLENLGYLFYNPPRTDRGPGSVFRFARTQSGSLVISPICRNLFANLKTEKANVTIPKESSTETLNVGFFTQFIADLWQHSAKAQTHLKRDGRVLVSFKNASSVYLLEEDLINADGTPRSITPQCYGQLKKLDEKGELENNVFIIQDAIEVGRATYELSEQSFISGEGEVNAKSILIFKPHVQYKQLSKLAFEILSPRFVAYKAFLLTEYMDTGLTTDGTAIIKARPMSVAELE
ncbi:MAG: hypothetical protein ACFCVA_15095 [Gammaproteobacteria bacterium]